MMRDFEQKSLLLRTLQKKEPFTNEISARNQLVTMGQLICRSAKIVGNFLRPRLPLDFSMLPTEYSIVTFKNWLVTINN